MIISDANVEPFVKFHLFHNEFNRNLKIAYGGLELLRENAVGQSGQAASMTTLPVGLEPWGPETKWRDVASASRSASRLLSEMGIVRVMSALEDFVTGIQAEYSRTAFLRPLSLPRRRRTAVRRRAPVPPKCDCTEDPAEADAKLENVCAQIGIDLRPISHVLPLLKLFSIARNCIVHQSGRANADLARQAESADVLACHRNWRTATGNPLPSLPAISEHREVPWLPRHPILASAVCHVIAVHLNQTLTAMLGEDGLVYMAAHHGLLVEERIHTPVKHGPEFIVRHLLSGRYRVKRISISETVQTLKTMDKWQACRTAYARLAR